MGFRIIKNLSGFKGFPSDYSSYNQFWFRLLQYKLLNKQTLKLANETKRVYTFHSALVSPLPLKGEQLSHLKIFVICESVMGLE